MAAPRTVVKIADVIDNAKVGRLQISLFVLCAACLILDGFDVQVVGYVAPTIFQEWGVPRSVLGNVLAAGNFGVLLGSLVFTMVADKVGRRPVLLAATVFFSLLTLLTAQVSSVSAVDDRSLHRGDRPRLHHPQRDGPDRRIQSAPVCASRSWPAFRWGSRRAGRWPASSRRG